MRFRVRSIASLSFQRGHDDRHRRPLVFGPVTLGRRGRELLVSRDQEGEDHEADDQAGDVGEEERDHPAHDRADRSLKLASPRLGYPDAERDPRERQPECDRETKRGPKPRDRGLTPGETMELIACGVDGTEISVGDSDLVVERGQRRRRGSSSGSVT